MTSRILTLCLAFFLSFNLYATHLLGSHISYKYIGNDSYELIFTYYRDCNEVAFSNPSSASAIKCAGGGSYSLSLTLRSIDNITPSGYSSGTSCSPQNTYGSGDGIERHVYVDTLDLNDSTFKSRITCCEIEIATGQCCRPSDINTGSQNENHFNFASLNICLDEVNSSPESTVDVFPVLCCNQPYFFNLGVIDTLDHDSISYAWGHPLRGTGSNIGYTGVNYSYNHPFQVYYPGSLGPPYVNSQASPPIGIYLDPDIGDLIFTPTRCDEVTTAVIEVTEWRKDSTGTMVEIGKTRYDNVFRSMTCPANNPPEIDGPYDHSVCAGDQICFNITTDDQIYVPPPPDPVPLADTVSISWNRAISGATFTVLNPNALHQTGRFCWDTELSDASIYPYTFVVTARDNAIPLNRVTLRSFRVKVRRTPTTENVIDELNCNEFKVLSVLDSNLSPTSIRRQVLDTNRTIVFNNNALRWKSTGTYLSVNTTDTLLLDSAGVYVIEYVLNNGGCSNKQYDTIEALHVTIPASPIISKSGTVLYSTIPGVQWYKDGEIITGAIGDSLITSDTGIYSARYIDSFGCKSEESNLISKTAGIGKVMMEHLKIYPNPTKGSITIETINGTMINTIKLYDLRGKEILSENQVNSRKHILNWDGTDGLYFLVIETDSGSITTKISKMDL